MGLCQVAAFKKRAYSRYVSLASQSSLAEVPRYVPVNVLFSSNETISRFGDSHSASQPEQVQQENN